MEFEEHEDHEEEEINNMSVLPPGYDSSSRPKTTAAGETRKGGRVESTIRYRECLKNHAVSIGAHALDGCGEFMADGDEGTLDALKCAACNCHRNFHRKETDGAGATESIYENLTIYPPGGHHNPQFSPNFYRPPAGYLHLTPQPRPLALPAAGSGGGAYSREEDVSNPSSSGGGGSGGLKKRFRSKFSHEQKDKMLGFSERLGWRIQKHDEAAVDQFCTETGVHRNVLKVWMHNNKHTLGKKP